MRKQRKNRTLILEALATGDKSQAELIVELGLSAATVCRWLEDLVASKEAHIRRYWQHPHGGPATAIYRKGPKPKGWKVQRPAAIPQVLRTRRSRKRMRASGEWEDVLANNRAKYWSKKAVKRDALTAALFGAAK